MAAGSPWGGAYITKLIIRQAVYEATHEFEYEWTLAERMRYVRTGETPDGTALNFREIRPIVGDLMA